MLRISYRCNTAWRFRFSLEYFGCFCVFLLIWGQFVLRFPVVFFGIFSPVCFEFSCQYQCKLLPGKTCVLNDVLCVQ